jgi:pyrroline-5-carboxylate reductase
MHIEGPLLLVGCGKMGGALLDGWLAGGLAAT